MLTHGQSDFFVSYIDPEFHALRSYYPDFLIEKEDGRYVIVEVKGGQQDRRRRCAGKIGLSYADGLGECDDLSDDQGE
jgi:hypothetical protein